MFVKVCNFRDKNFDQDLIDSLIDTGFAVITHHGIDFGLIRETQKVWRQFFTSPQEVRDFYVNEENPNMGYKAFKTETAVGAKLPDLKAFYHYYPGEAIPEEAFQVTNKLFFELNDIGSQILSTIDRKTPGPFSYREACQDSLSTLLRAIYYPAIDFEVKVGQVRAAAHEDIGMLTLLVAASAPGLEVKDKYGVWHAVPFEENSIVVNVGDSLQLASGGQYKSTTHRVVNPSDSISDRVSIPLFIHTHGNTVLTDNITAQQFLNQRLEQIYNRKP